jgi:hypothetical protein
MDSHKLKVQGAANYFSKIIIMTTTLLPGDRVPLQMLLGGGEDDGDASMDGNEEITSDATLQLGPGTSHQISIHSHYPQD